SGPAARDRFDRAASPGPARCGRTLRIAVTWRRELLRVLVPVRRHLARGRDALARAVRHRGDASLHGGGLSGAVLATAASPPDPLAPRSRPGFAESIPASRPGLGSPRRSTGWP